MAYTTDQYDILTAAIASGSTTVKYADKEVQYRSLNDMLRIQSLMAAELNIAVKVIRRKYASVTNGITPRYPDWKNEHLR